MSVSNKGYEARGDPGKHALATTGVEGGGDKQRQACPLPAGFTPKSRALTHTQTQRRRGGYKEASPSRSSPSGQKNRFLAHHLVVSQHCARSSCWKCSPALPTRCFLELLHAPPSRAVHSAPCARRAPPISTLPSRADLQLTPLRSPSLLDLRFFFPLPPPAAVGSGYDPWLEPEYELAPSLGILICFVTSPLQKRFSCSRESLLILCSWI